MDSSTPTLTPSITPTATFTWTPSITPTPITPTLTFTPIPTALYPSIPTITAPKDNVVVNVANPVMQWDDFNSPEVLSRLVVRKASDNSLAYMSLWLSKSAAQCDADTDCAFEVPLELPNGAYNWFVQVNRVVNGKSYIKRTPGFATFKLLFPDRAV